MRLAGWLACAILASLGSLPAAAIPDPPPSELRPIRIDFEAPPADLPVGEYTVIEYRVVDLHARSVLSADTWVAGPASVATLKPDGPGRFRLHALSEGVFTIHVTATSGSDSAQGLISVSVTRSAGAPNALQSTLSLQIAALVLTILVEVIAIVMLACELRRAPPPGAGRRGPPPMNTDARPRQRPTREGAMPDKRDQDEDQTLRSALADKPRKTRLPAASPQKVLPPIPPLPPRSLRVERTPSRFIPSFFRRDTHPPAPSTIIVHGDYVPAKVESWVEINDSVVTRATFDGSFHAGPRPEGATDAIVRKMEDAGTGSATNGKPCTFCGGGMLTFGRKITLPGGFEAEGLCDECQLLVVLMMGRRSRG